MTTMDDVKRFADEMGFEYDEHETGLLVGQQRMNNYDHPDGTKNVIVVCMNIEREFLMIWCPMAFVVPRERAPIFLTACAMVQQNTRGVFFEWDHTDGEVRPIVEFPLMNAQLTKKQFHKGFSNLIEAVDHWNHALQRAANEQVIDSELADFLVEGRHRP